MAGKIAQLLKFLNLTEWILIFPFHLELQLIKYEKLSKEIRNKTRSGLRTLSLPLPFASNRKEILANQLTSISPEIIKTNHTVSL